MNRKFLLDSLDGLKMLVFSLLGPKVRENTACVPMTTDGPWNDSEVSLYERLLGFPHSQVLWAPGGFINVPLAKNQKDRERWIQALCSINYNPLFLDPDTGFCRTYLKAKDSDKLLEISELERIAKSGKALIVYRHLYWPKIDQVPSGVYPYVWQGLEMLAASSLYSFAYQSQTASFFFLAAEAIKIEPYWKGLKTSMKGISSSIVNRRLIKRTA